MFDKVHRRDTFVQVDEIFPQNLYQIKQSIVGLKRDKERKCVYLGSTRIK